MMLTNIILLIIFWLIIYGTPHSIFSLVISGLGILAVCLIAKYLKITNNFNITRKRIFYILWLIKEVCVSSFKVTKIIWGKKADISPQLFIIDVNSMSELKKTIYANSITLTPGTISINIESDQFLIHALNDVFVMKSNNIMVNKIKSL
jgi:multicomponent Na+:H+ antiporter subunit E